MISRQNFKLKLVKVGLKGLIFIAVAPLGAFCIDTLGAF